MINLFLKAKHWQLFILTVGVPFTAYFSMIGYIFSTVIGGNPNPADIFEVIWIFPLIMILFVGGTYCWMWSIAIGLQRSIPAEVKMKVMKFKIFFLYPFVYILLIILTVIVVLSIDMSGFEPKALIVLVPLVILMHLFAIFCSFYSLYFVAKAIKTALLQRETRFSEFTEEFFLVWFYPVGVWILQPRINRLIEEERLEDRF